MREYCIYCPNISSGKTFILETFDNIDVAKISLYNIVSLEEERGRTYYVDNDFFNNKYATTIIGKYLKLLSREVTEWKKNF